MEQIIEKIMQHKKENNAIAINLINEKLTTKILCYSNLCSKKLTEFSKAFNNLFNALENKNNILIASIIENDELFEESRDYLNNQKLFETIATKNFNKATITTSEIKCTKDENYYIMRCYDYFIYIFNKKKKECYMIIKNNKKSITMINILLLTPYLLYGELYAVHGGLVSNNNQNILISNSSLGGKTTFALLFALNGWNIITEETTYITKSGYILPYNIRNYFNIRVGTYLTFEDYFLKKGIINETFLSMKGMSNKKLFEYGKENQFSIDFDTIGKSISFNEMRITHSLKVSIKEMENYEILKCSPTKNINSFLELSLAPTVLLFQELLNYYDINKKERTKELNKIFKNIISFILNSGFDYKENYKEMTKKMNIM